MKRHIKWTFVIIAIIAVTGAFAAIKQNNIKTGIEYIGLFISGSRYYVATDGSGNPLSIPTEWEEGDQFSCVGTMNLCTVTVEKSAALHFEASLGLYYYNSIDVIDFSLGSFEITN